jgi:hypothetical protein
MRSKTTTEDVIERLGIAVQSALQNDTLVTQISVADAQFLMRQISPKTPSPCPAHGIASREPFPVMVRSFGFPID